MIIKIGGFKNVISCVLKVLAKWNNMIKHNIFNIDQKHVL